MPLGMEVGLNPVCVRWGPSSPPQKRGRSPLPNFWPMSIVAKRLDGSRWHLARRWALVQATLCQMGTQLPSPCNHVARTCAVCWRSERSRSTVTYTATVGTRTSSSTAVRTAATHSVACMSASSRTCCHATRPTCSPTSCVGFTCRRARRAPGASSSGTWASRTATRWRFSPAISVNQLPSSLRQPHFSLSVSVLPVHLLALSTHHSHHP